MKQGDTIKIRNAAGLLTVELDKLLSTGDVARYTGDGSLPCMEHPRLEFHKKSCETIVTLYNQDKGNRTIYVAFPDYDSVEIWKSHFDESEIDEMIYETIQEWKGEINYKKDRNFQRGAVMD